MTTLRFTNRSAVVTGGASGMGQAAAFRFAREGAQVVVIDIDQGAADATVADILRQGGRATAVAIDLRQPQHVQEALERSLDFSGGIDVLVNSAGKGSDCAVIDTQIRNWHDVLDVNLNSCFYCCRVFARHMAGNKYGRIVNIASHSALLGSTGRGAYAASKAGMIGLTRVLAIELADAGVTVNAIAPGAIETPMTAPQSAARRQQWKMALPIPRYGTADEVAAAIAFLASDEAGYITGQTLCVDGGFTAAGLMMR